MVETEKHPKTICLVGSTDPKWKAQYRKVEETLTHIGYVVLSVVWFKDQLPNIEVCGVLGCDGNFESHRELLERIHFQKIRMADAVVLIHADAVGHHTREELEFAYLIGKPAITYSIPQQVQRELNAVLNP